MGSGKNSRIEINAKIVILLVLLSVALGFAFDFFAGHTEKVLYPRKYSEFVEKYADAYGVPEPIVYAVIKTESNFDPKAVSSADAMGLMQLTEDTYEWIGSILGEKTSAFGIYDPETNIRYGTYMLSYLYSRFENWDTVYAAYNAGIGRVLGWLDDPEYADGNGGLKNIPFRETREYIQRVNDARKEYENLYY